MLRHCPNPAVCKSCGKKHDVIDNADCEERRFCSVCNEPGYLAISSLCPSRLKNKKPLSHFDKEGKKRDFNVTRGRSCSRTSGSTRDEYHRDASNPDCYHYMVGCLGWHIHQPFIL
ncbi:hypothetical protein HPB48_017935 [Haemaphysalis longicornis]|uniref:Uncharacterized protein n=1 Tax=Haemaphysalis longicornis TaxID=44386 RepID=A0A9J6G9K2_HAELO|nr:hypothetical protein HPB48_017935 [Haemaphysalis longicornis]